MVYPAFHDLCKMEIGKGSHSSSKTLGDQTVFFMHFSVQEFSLLRCCGHSTYTWHSTQFWFFEVHQHTEVQQHPQRIETLCGLQLMWPRCFPQGTILNLAQELHRYRSPSLVYNLSCWFWHTALDGSPTSIANCLAPVNCMYLPEPQPSIGRWWTCSSDAGESIANTLEG